MGSLGMWLFIAALFMLFASSLLAYILIRLNAAKPHEVEIIGYPKTVIPLHTLHLPVTLWASTFLVVGVSIAIAVAQFFFRRHLQQPYRISLIVALALAAEFISVQTPAMANLVRSHRDMIGQHIHLYGLLFVLVLLHALHVVGGMIGLGRLVIKVQHGDYDPSDINPSRNVALYWHFLDLVWIAMFATFYIMR